MYCDMFESGFLPEQIRDMPAYDVWMINYAAVAKKINKDAEKEPGAAKVK